MAKRFLTSLGLVNASADPVSGSNGDVYYNSTTHKTKIYQNNAWTVVPSLLSDLNDVSASSVSNGQVLTYNGTSSKWQPQSSPPAATATGPTFPENPSLGEFFYNTTDQALYFFINGWNEIAFTAINLDGGTSFTTEFNGTFDGGNAATLTFADGTYDAGNSSTTY